MEANVVISTDTLQASSAEVEDIVADYYASTIASRDMPPLEFDWPGYLRAERGGATLLITARMDDHMIGFVLYLIIRHPHHMSMSMAMCDMIGVRPEYRGAGLGGSLMEVGEQCLTDMGIDTILHMYREIYGDTIPLFVKRGYVPFERAYIKKLSPQIQEK